MGSSSSKPEYPFPVPARYTPPLRSKSGKWSSLSMKKRKGKDREKYEDFIVPRYPTPTATYGFPYYQPAFPAYYAPQGVQMVLQPFGVQQPYLAMPQPYVPVTTYPTTAAPVQHAVVPAQAFQPAPAAQMPVPAPATTPAPIPVPAPAPAQAPASVIPPPSVSFAPPPSAPTQMPQPHPIPEPPNQGPVIPPTPVIADPVIPPPPIVISEPRTTSDAPRPRFTGFYRPADLPSPPPVGQPEPVRPPTTGPAGRTPFRTTMPMPEPSSTPMPMPQPSSTPMPMPTPAPASMSNPLPAPPADVWDTSPYRQVLANLPTDVSTLLDLQSSSNMLVGIPEPVPRPSSRLGTLFGASSSKDKGKGTLRGLFRSKSTSAHSDIGSSSGSRHGHGHGHGRTQTMTSIVIPPPGPSSSMPMPAAPTHGPPIKFDHIGDYAGFVNHSPHRVMYKNRMYPTALHLLEAMKFTHRPDLQERVRSCKDVNDMYPLSASFQDHVRPDWGQVFLQTMEDVLYLKFKQHPTLRTLLLHTGLAEIIYKDENTYWGEGPLGEGANELGRALVRVRERLRHEGER